jgi:hypothetical protein
VTLALPGEHFGACNLAGFAGHARHFNKHTTTESKQHMKILDIPQSGKIGIQVAASNRSGQYRRQFVIPTNPRTQAQKDVRRALGNAAARWRTLTEDQRAAWAAIAKTRNTIPRLGQSGTLTGAQLFTKINCTLATIGADQVTTPPALPEFPDNPVGALAITNVGGVISLKLACPNTPGSNTTVRASAPCSQGITCCNDYRVLGVLPAPAQGSCDITNLFRARYGSPTVGTKVFVRVNQNINGWEDVPVETSAIVPSAS